jgi:mono/diheme cytochrome c family protein
MTFASQGGFVIRRLVVVVVAGLVLGKGAVAMAQDAAKIENGKKVYAEAKPMPCKTCHSVAGAGNAKGPLDGVGSKLTAEEIKAWIRTAKDMTAKTKAERKPPMPDYPPEKLSEQDLDALTAYLLSLKK